MITIEVGIVIHHLETPSRTYHLMSTNQHPVELFRPFAPAPDPDHGMYKVLRSLNATKEHLALILLVDGIHQSIHVYPKFGLVAPRDWTGSSALERCTRFYTNSWVDRYFRSTDTFAVPYAKYNFFSGKYLRFEIICQK